MTQTPPRRGLTACARAALMLLALAAAAPLAAQYDLAHRRSAGVGPPAPSYDGRPLGAWVDQLADRVPEARSRAAYVLAELGPEAASAVPALRATLGDEVPMVRYAAAWALSEIGDAARAAIPDLRLRAAEDSIGDVRWIAAKALRKLGEAEARPAIRAPRPAPAASDTVIPGPRATPGGGERAETNERATGSAPHGPGTTEPEAGSG
jgi:hypothetical protein